MQIKMPWRLTKDGGISPLYNEYCPLCLSDKLVFTKVEESPKGFNAHCCDCRTNVNSVRVPVDVMDLMLRKDETIVKLQTGLNELTNNLRELAEDVVDLRRSSIDVGGSY